MNAPKFRHHRKSDLLRPHHFLLKPCDVLLAFVDLISNDLLCFRNVLVILRCLLVSGSNKHCAPFAGQEFGSLGSNTRVAACNDCILPLEVDLLYVTHRSTEVLFYKDQ